MAFFNREIEFRQLEKMASSGQKEMLVLYGRRRLGKTTLLREFARKHPALFLSCPLSTSSEALRLFQNQMAVAFEEPLLGQTLFPGWSEAMRFAFEEASKQGIAVIFDEFPYLMRSVAGIDSVIQHIWDEMDRAIWIGLSGSLISVMLERIMGPNAPLYGRRTGMLQLKPMAFAEVSLFYPKSSFSDRAIWYAFFGGVPAYAEKAASFPTPRKSVVELVLSENGVLYQEPDFLVREELREPGTYFSILRSLAAGMTRPNEIAQDAGVAHSGINKYLDTLRRMQLIKRRVPITEKHPERSTKGIYVLADPFLRFWFRYVFPNRSVIELGKGRELYGSKIKPDLNNYMGPIYEEMCHEEILRRGLEILGWKPFRLGRYWDSQSEIGLVAEDRDAKRVAFIECKWGRSVHMERILNLLRKKADRILYYAGWHKQHYVMSRTITRHPHHIRLG
ncbi:MAG: ATP-binding protein [Deltaproteobacteria bacterium]|nr:ATP-binding protein [Deltaproteobacteria bacterium]